VIALLGALCVALSSCGLIGPPDDPDGVAADFVAAWPRGTCPCREGVSLGQLVREAASAPQ
jgi:hypothetical protein